VRNVSEQPQHLLGVDGPLSFAQLAHRLQYDEDTRDQLTNILSASRHPAFFFECAPTSRMHAHLPFSFVIVPSPTLPLVKPDPTPFGRHFSFSSPTATFENLGSDAILVAPSPNNLPLEAGTHLASFLRAAPKDRVDSFWQATGLAIEGWLLHSDNILWLSTSGLGVHWLHMRLDTRPKYYQYSPFAKPPPR